MTTKNAVRPAHRYPFMGHRGLVMLGMMGLLACAPASEAYEIVTVSNGGAINGVVTLSGQVPPTAPLKVTKNQDYCGHYIADPTYSVDRRGGLHNVIVYLKEISKGKAPKNELPSLVNEDCMMSPRVQGAMVGGPVKISSNDDILHNAHLLKPETNATILNVALPFKGVTMTKPLPSTPGLIKIKCDAHEWMHAWIMGLEHPYFATTDETGHFSITDIPPGSYTLVAWHEAAGEKSAPIDVAAGHTAHSMITLGDR